MRRRLFLLILAGFATAGPVHASFECLPGPAPGSLSDWVGRSAQGSTPRDLYHGSLSLGRPASIDPLVWTHLSAGRNLRGFHFSAEAYHLSLAEIYQESVLGLWGGWRGLALGLRRWQVDWEDGTNRAGFSGSASLGCHRRAVGIRIALQDLRLGRSDPTAPASRFGTTIDLSLDASLRVAGRYAHGRSGDPVQGELFWSPHPQLAVRQAIRFPGENLTTGLLIRIGRILTQIWTEPVSPVGPRIGLSVALGPPPWGS